MTVSQNIKKAREQRKLTLDAAAAATGVSRSMLAQIEKGDVNPTVTVLWKIANGYKVSFTSIVERSAGSSAVVLGSETTPFFEDDGRCINYPAFCFDEKRLFETYRIVIKPDGYLVSAPHLGGTEEYITVFDGELEIKASGESFHLRKGDSVRFKADVPHEYKNLSDTEVQLSMLIYYGG